MPATKGNKRLTERKRMVEMQVRGLTAKRAFLECGLTEFMPYVIAQAIQEQTILTTKERLRVSQILNGNVGLKDGPLLELLERAVTGAKRAA